MPRVDDGMGGISPHALKTQTIRRRLIAVALATDNEERLTEWLPGRCVLPRNEIEIMIRSDNDRLALQQSLTHLDHLMRALLENP